MTAKMTIAFAIAIVVIIGFVSSGVRAMGSSQNVASITSAELEQKMVDPTSFFLLDVREPSEFEAGHIKNATLIPLGTLPDHLNEIPKDKTIVVYCRSGNRSARAASILMEKGYANVLNLTGGMSAWTNKCLTDKKYC